MQINPCRVHVWHNLLWSKYKGAVFSSLWSIANPAEFEFCFTQIAETERGRDALSSVDRRYHTYPYELLFKGSISNVSRYRRLASVLKDTLRSNADLFVLSGYHRLEYWLQLLIVKIRRRKVAIFLDSTEFDNPKRSTRDLLKKLFIRRVDGVFGYGERTRAYAMSLGAQQASVFVPCVAAALPPDYSAHEALRARCDARPSASAPRYLYVGRLAAEKGLELLLRAFEMVRQRIPDATLCLVGDGPLRRSLEQQVSQDRLAGAVTFTGSMEGNALYEELTRASVLVLPSRSEPWGLVVNEAMAYGCPVIVSSICGCVPELVIEGTTGFTHKSEDAVDLALKMALAPVWFSDIEAVARSCQHVAQQFTPDKAASRILEGCRQLVG